MILVMTIIHMYSLDSSVKMERHSLALSCFRVCD